MNKKKFKFFLGYFFLQILQIAQLTLIVPSRESMNRGTWLLVLKPYLLCAMQTMITS